MLGLPPSILQLVGVADPSMKEPVRVAVTASAIIVQSSTQDEASDVVHNDRVVDVWMRAVLMIQVRSPLRIIIVLHASITHQSKGITMIN